MVLSNKKLKLKLRAELDENNNSLKTVLDTPITRLSKRQKRRNLRSSQPPQELNKETETQPSSNKKRKRNLEDNPDDTPKKNSKKKKKKQKQKKDKNKNKSTTVEENGSKLQGDLPQPTVLTSTDTTTCQDNADVLTKVYVGGIPYYSTEDDIRSYFQSCGTITEVDCMTFPETGKFRGIAIISFKTEAAAKRALALDGADMGGLFLKIQPYKATRANKASDFAPEILEGYNRIYVGNLSWDITEEELRKFFNNCEITSLRFGMNKETGEFRGYAHVDFSDSQSLKTALALDQSVLFGRPVRISCAVPLKKKTGTHTSSTDNGANGDQSNSTGSGKMNGADGDNSGSTGSGKMNGADGDNSGSTGSGKMRRRTCYECGEKGHMFSACPKKQTVAATTT